LARPRGVTSMSYSGCQLGPADDVRDRRGHLRERAATDGDSRRPVSALAGAADLRQLAAELVRGQLQAAQRDVQLAAFVASAARRARKPSSVFAHAGVFGFGLRISSVSVAENTPPNAPTSSSSARDRRLARLAALDLVFGLVEIGASARARGSAASFSFTDLAERPITSAASRTSPRSVRTSSVAGSRSKAARAVPFSQWTVRARVTRARSAKTTTLSISPEAARGRERERRRGRDEDEDEDGVGGGGAHRQFW
jgi:hypothetical protein